MKEAAVGEGNGDGARQLSKLGKISHDLRTPISALKMALSLLQAHHRRDGQVRAEDESLIATMQRNVARLEAIANDLSIVADEELGGQENAGK